MFRPDFWRAAGVSVVVESSQHSLARTARKTQRTHPTNKATAGTRRVLQNRHGFGRQQKRAAMVGDRSCTRMIVEEIRSHHDMVARLIEWQCCEIV